MQEPEYDPMNQVHPGPLEGIDRIPADTTQARTGNTEREQEMYAAGIKVGEENAKHNAAIRAGGVPAGWKLVPIEPTREMWAAVNKLDDEMAAGAYDGKGASIEQVWACLVDAAPGVSTVEDASFPAGAIVNGRVLADRLEAYPFESQGGDLRLCSDWVEFRRCFEYLAEWVGTRAPAAGDARDADMYWDAADIEHFAGTTLDDAVRYVADDIPTSEMPVTLTFQCAMTLPNVQVLVTGLDVDGELQYEVMDAAIAAQPTTSAKEPDHGR